MIPFFLGTQVHILCSSIAIYTFQEWVYPPNGEYNSYHNGGSGFFGFPASASSFSSSRPRRRPKSSICSRTVRPGVSSLSSQSCVSWCLMFLLMKQQHFLDLKKSCLQQLFELLIGCSILFNEVSVAAPAGNSRPPQSLGARMPSADHPKRPRNKNSQLIKYLCMGHEPVPRKLSQIFYDPFWRLLASPNTIKKSISNSICSEKCISTSHQTQCLPLCEATARQSASLQFLAAPKGSNWFYAPPQTPQKMYRLSGKSIKIIITFTFFDPPKKGNF